MLKKTYSDTPADGRASRSMQIGCSDSEPMPRTALREQLAELAACRHRLEACGNELRRTNVELLQSRDHFRNLYSQLPVACLALDTEGRITDLNQAAEQLLKRERRLLQGRPLEHYILMEDRERIRRLHGRIAGADRRGTEEVRMQLPEDGFQRVRLQGVFMDGTESKSAECQIALIPLDEQPVEDRTQFDGTPLNAGSLVDIDAIYRNAPIGLCVLDTEMRYVRINERMAAFNGRTVAQHTGRTVREILPAAAWIAEAVMRKVLQKREPCLGIEVPGAHGGAQERTMLEHWIPILDKHKTVLAVSVVAVDITAQKLAAKEEMEMTRQLEQRVLERTADLRMLSSRMESAQEAERQRIAGGLHDDVGQILGVCDLKLNALRSCFDKKDKEEHDRLVGEVIARLGEAAKQIRSLTFELRSATLFEAGFTEAAIELCDHMQHQHDIVFEISAPDDLPAIPTRLRPMLYRGLREVLFNIARHAHASRAGIRLSSAGRMLRIEVRDNGIGFDARRNARSLSRSGGFGLYNLRERLQETGGKLTIRSGPGRGTTLVMEIKLDYAGGTGE